MNRRSGALRMLSEAWRNGVCTDFNRGNIYYEEDLHGSVYHHVRCLSDDHIVHIDALKHRKQLGNWSPDIVICSSEHVDVLLELKYAPWIDISQYGFDQGCLDDVHKLIDIARRANAEDTGLTCELKVDPHGQGESQKGGIYYLDGATGYAFGVITQADRRDRTRVTECMRNLVENSDIPLDRFWLFYAWVHSSSLPDFGSVGGHELPLFE